MWYVAEIVERIRVAGDQRVVTHVNFVLVSAVDAIESHSRRAGSSRDDAKTCRHFCPPRPSRGPDYTAGDIIEEVRRLAR